MQHVNTQADNRQANYTSRPLCKKLSNQLRIYSASQQTNISGIQTFNQPRVQQCNHPFIIQQTTCLTTPLRSTTLQNPPELLKFK